MFSKPRGPGVDYSGPHPVSIKLDRRWLGGVSTRRRRAAPQKNPEADLDAEKCSQPFNTQIQETRKHLTVVYDDQKPYLGHGGSVLKLIPEEQTAFREPGTFALAYSIEELEQHGVAQLEAPWSLANRK